MRGEKAKINIRYKDTGQVARIPRFKADPLVDSGRAVFVSNSIRKAAMAGVTVTPKMTDKQIKAAILAVKSPPPKTKETEEADGKVQSKRGSNRPRRKN